MKVADILRDTLVKLEEVTQCPVCLESVGPAVRQCIRGHGFCYSCIQKMITCPLCRALFSLHKPKMLVQLMEQLPKLCEYNKQGCCGIFLAKDQLEHKLFCEYRSIKCKVGEFNECKWSGMVKDFKSHVQRHHLSFYSSYPCASSRKMYIKNFKENWHTKHYLHVVENHMFLLFVHKDEMNRHRFYLVVKQIPLGRPNKEHYFHVTLHGKPDCYKKSIKAYFTFDDNEQFQRSPYCMIVSTDRLNPASKSGSLELTCKVLNCKY